MAFCKLWTQLGRLSFVHHHIRVGCFRGVIKPVAIKWLIVWTIKNSFLMNNILWKAILSTEISESILFVVSICVWCLLFLVVFCLGYLKYLPVAVWSVLYIIKGLLEANLHYYEIVNIVLKISLKNNNVIVYISGTKYGPAKCVIMALGDLQPLNPAWNFTKNRHTHFQKANNVNPQQHTLQSEVLETHLRRSRCIQDQIRQISEQLVERGLHVAVGENASAQVHQQPGGELPLAGLGLQGQRHGERRDLAPHGAQVQVRKQLLTKMGKEI